MPRMFGTDGVRGLANRDLTAQLALDLGDAAVRVLGDDERSEFESRRRALVGRDTRVSGDFLAAALSAGMSAGGFDVIDAGIIPTPGVAYLTSVLNVEMGAVISASHNPMPDNGIKFFARGGFKLPDTKEDEIEAVLGQDWDRPTGAGVGRVSHDTATATNLYIDHLVSAIAPVGPDKSQPTPLKGLKIVADCANGATSVVAPEALRRAGADVTVINASPDGYNINKNAGSTHPEQLQAMVKASGAVMGVAFDGDADRCLAVDEDGNMVNGDQIMGILARAKKNAGKLNHDTLVVTVMSNLGLKLALRSMGIKTVQTNVGDRYVLEEMLRGDYSLGGEQSGHVINREFATTGDGTLTALTLCNEVVKSGKSLKELAADFPQLPQTLINVPNVDKLAACCCVRPAPSRSCASWPKPKPSSRQTKCAIASPRSSPTNSPCKSPQGDMPHVRTQLESGPRTQPRGRKAHQNRRQRENHADRAGRRTGITPADHRLRRPVEPQNA